MDGMFQSWLSLMIARRLVEINCSFITFQIVQMTSSVLFRLVKPGQAVAYRLVKSQKSANCHLFNSINFKRSLCPSVSHCLNVDIISKQKQGESSRSLLMSSICVIVIFSVSLSQSIYLSQILFVQTRPRLSVLHLVQLEQKWELTGSVGLTRRLIDIQVLVYKHWKEISINQKQIDSMTMFWLLRCRESWCSIPFHSVQFHANPFTRSELLCSVERASIIANLEMSECW